MKNKIPSKEYTKTLGPVADLEKHLPNEWWRDLFNALYLKTDSDVVDNNTNTTKETDLLIAAANLSKDQHILDLCCGQGRHLFELYEKGFKHLTGIDRSRYLIRVAKKHAKKHTIPIQFHEGDARNIRLAESSIDCVVMFGNSFGYFDSQEDDTAVLNSILNVLKGNGYFVMDMTNGDWIRETFQHRSWEWIDENYFVCRERSLSNDKTRLISREVIVNSNKGVIADQFYAVRLYTFDDIKVVLSDLNFKDITLHEDYLASSNRNQDLGMMENRMFISARAPQKVSKKPCAPNTLPVTVILGDPNLPDTVKRNQCFNSEDLETIYKLKDALSHLNYDFTFFDNHHQFIDTLAKHPPAFVLNLCDEGYNNNALKELHVPAYLEMLGVPYSGSGPSCLAICYNKSIVRAVASCADIPVPLETYYNPNDQAATIPSIFPALLKPNMGDSSVGITQQAVVEDSTSLIAYLDKLKTEFPSTPILIQEFLCGAEYSVGLIGNLGNLQALPILSVNYNQLPDSLPKILGYESKWIPDSPYWNKIQYIRADISLELERLLIDYSTLLFERLDCKDYARFDFRADADGQIKLLEANPNPGWCWDGKLNLMAEFAGLTYSELLEKIIQLALERTKQSK